MSNISETEKMLMAWGSLSATHGFNRLGYSTSRMYRSESGLTPDEEDALLNVTAAVEALRESEPQAADVVIARWLWGDDMEKIGSAVGSNNKAIKYYIIGLSWITGYMDSRFDSN